jgi:hypothetical protein
MINHPSQGRKFVFVSSAEGHTSNPSKQQASDVMEKNVALLFTEQVVLLGARFGNVERLHNAHSKLM